VNRILNLTNEDQNLDDLANAAEEFNLELAPAHKGRPNQAAQIIEIGRRIFDLFQCNKEPYASCLVDGFLNTWELKDQCIQDRLGREFERQYGKPPGKDAWNAALRSLRWRALESKEIKVGLRVSDDQQHIWLDLANDKWQVVEITANGWQVKEASQVPVRFVRTANTLPLPLPQTGGSLSALQSFINVDTGDFPLVCGWLCGALRPSNSCAALIVTGAQGSAKTTMCKLLRRLVDPNMAEMVIAPNREEMVMVSAQHQWAVGIDNISTIPHWLSDVLCVARPEIFVSLWREIG